MLTLNILTFHLAMFEYMGYHLGFFHWSHVQYVPFLQTTPSTKFREQASTVPCHSTVPSKGPCSTCISYQIQVIQTMIDRWNGQPNISTWSMKAQRISVNFQDPAPAAGIFQSKNFADLKNPRSVLVLKTRRIFFQAFHLRGRSPTPSS